ncbi:chemotaxis protein CheB [Fibrisoma montanum]|uniref:protein-glutamate methylesterase n=1 Tax=Fibrisoma montanum TaxID=2305895 RepID=A0A418M1A6_9BACT|nr:chemotaxis protein CheB [Fibrisoma montanum]RIV19447.1 chemotaxis protein CheB [Fibrisoma montanum]
MAENRLVSNSAMVLIGGSTGSIDVLLNLLPALRPPLTFALVIVLHRKSATDTSLADLFALKTSLPLQEVEDKDAILPGHIYLAPADYHLLIEHDGTFSLDDSEKVNYSRPSIDVTFESAADVYGSALTGILLSGANADGSAGLQAIKRAGGLTIVQHPDTAQVAYMPQQAILNTKPDYVLDVEGMVSVLR